jgi:hypothetical protein
VEDKNATNKKAGGSLGSDHHHPQARRPLLQHQHQTHLCPRRNRVRFYEKQKQLSTFKTLDHMDKTNTDSSAAQTRADAPDK